MIRSTDLNCAVPEKGLRDFSRMYSVPKISSLGFFDRKPAMEFTLQYPLAMCFGFNDEIHKRIGIAKCGTSKEPNSMGLGAGKHFFGLRDGSSKWFIDECRLS